MATNNIKAVYRPNRDAVGLASLRKQRGLTQRALADLALVHMRTVCRVERLYHPPTKSTAIRLAIVLGVDIEQLYIDPNTDAAGLAA